MAIIKVSDLPVKASLDDADRVVGYSTSTGGTSLLLGSSFAAIQTSAQKSADSAAASAASASSLKTDMEADISAAKSAMATAQTDGVKAVQTAQATGVSAVQSAQAEALSAITLEKTSGVAAVKEAGEAAQATSVSAVKAQEAASIQAIEADSVLAGYAKKDELSSAQSALSAQISAAITQAVAEAKLAAHPVGSVYCTVDSASPADLFGGAWEEISAGRVLQGADSSHAAGTTTEAGLPNINGVIGATDVWGYGNVSYRGFSGAFAGSSTLTVTKSFAPSDMTGGNPNSSEYGSVSFDASRSSSIYGNSSTVQPPAYFVHI